MRRRSVLVSIAALQCGSGCAGRRDEAEGERTRSPPPTESPSPATTESTSPTTADTPTLDDLPCPPAAVDPDAAVCAHTADDPPVVVRAEARRAPVDDAACVRFVLANATGERLRFNPNNPDLYRYTGDGYDPVERRASGSGVVTVPADGEHAWRLTELPQFQRLVPDAYLFAIEVPSNGAVAADWVTCLAPFRLTAGRG